MKNQMIPLTVANSLDQSTKQKIETRGQQTVKQAIQNAKMAPQGQFDIFDDLGQVISNQQVDQFRDKTIYIGVQKVAGGAIQIDDDWDIGIDLDDIDKPVRKVVTFKDWGGTRFEVEPQGEERLIQAAERAGIRPRGGDPIEVRDGDGNDVSALRARDMIGRAFQVNPRAIEGGKYMQKRVETYPPIVPIDIIEQTTAFTAPRGRLEMGGLLIGHVDTEGRNVVVAGFFPEQTEATPGYCEFEGGFAAMAAAACDMANERCGGAHTPNLRIIGWIHTHPDIGIFLSGIDVRTFKNLRGMSQDGRCVAVVVDPLRKEHGVFRSPRSAENKDAEKANGKIRLSEDLKARYNKFLDRMRFLQMKNGKQRLPFLITGQLRAERRANGDIDDIEDALQEAVYESQRQIYTIQRELSEYKLVNQRDQQNQDRIIRNHIDSKIKEVLRKIEDRFSELATDQAKQSRINKETKAQMQKIEQVSVHKFQSQQEQIENLANQIMALEQKLPSIQQSEIPVLKPLVETDNDDIPKANGTENEKSEEESLDSLPDEKNIGIKDEQKKTAADATA